MLEKLFERKSKVLFLAVFILCISSLYLIINLFYAQLSDIIAINQEGITDKFTANEAWLSSMNSIFIYIIMFIVVASSLYALIGFIYEKKEQLMTSIILSIFFSFSVFAVECGIATTLKSGEVLIGIVQLLLILIILITPTMLLIIGYINQNELDEKFKKKKK